MGAGDHGWLPAVIQKERLICHLSIISHSGPQACASMGQYLTQSGVFEWRGGIYLDTQLRASPPGSAALQPQ